MVEQPAHDVTVASGARKAGAWALPCMVQCSAAPAVQSCRVSQASAPETALGLIRSKPKVAKLQLERPTAGEVVPLRANT